MQNLDPWAKYDEAMAYLRKQDPGSYFDEIADLIEELIARVVAHEARPEPRTKRAVEYELEQNRIKDALARRMVGYSSAAKDGAESNNRLSDDPGRI
jgi:hypothetical protein